MRYPNTYTVESVTASHPDKICDKISDSILDAYLTQDPYSRVAMEAFGAHDILVVGGEVTSTARVDAAEIARKVYSEEMGYEDPLSITTNIIQQSPDIAQGVDTGGAGDQGIMYGYATSETPEFFDQKERRTGKRRLRFTMVIFLLFWFLASILKTLCKRTSKRYLLRNFLCH